jgi:hypothetical protein
MKISLNSKFFITPYGGGMQFANYIKKFLEDKGNTVINHLNDNDIDIILHINPFPFLMKSSVFSFFDAYAYKLKHPKTVIVHRINECDERKGTTYMNHLQIKTARYSDFIVFISSWLQMLYEKMGMKLNANYKVILNGADETIFHLNEKPKNNITGKMKIVTHHWGGGYFKGHDIYQKLDNMLEDHELMENFEFTYIGNLPENVNYKNSKIIKPINGKALSDELKKHDLYLTASRNEPAGMHHIEGALCGLPILYINSGALPEYCSGYGICFEENNFKEKLLQMRNEFRFYENEIKKYNLTALKMSEDYLNLFLLLYKNKNEYALLKPMILKSFFFSVVSKIDFIIKKIRFKFL